MSFQTKHTLEYAQVTIDRQRCDACGLCVAVCKGAPLTMVDGVVRVDQAQIFGCYACGQCMAICPQDCIQVKGRDLYPEDMFPLPSAEARAAYAELHNLMAHRRSVRNYQNQPVPRELIEQILTAVSSAPMGIPPSDVEVLVFETSAAVQSFTADVIAYLQQHRWLFSDVMLGLMRPFMTRETTAMYKDFLVVAVKSFLDKYAQGEDLLTYGAPCALYFYASRLADPADPVVAATYAMLAAESLGLGSCMLGIIPYCFQYSRKLRQKYQVPHKSRQGLMLILGYPAITYQRGIKRRLGEVRFIN